MGVPDEWAQTTHESAIHDLVNIVAAYDTVPSCWHLSRDALAYPGASAYEPHAPPVRHGDLASLSTRRTLRAGWSGQGLQYSARAGDE